MTDLLIVVILLICMGTAINTLVRARKNGIKCIGCPSSRSCSGKSPGHAGCGGGCRSIEKSRDAMKRENPTAEQ